MLSINLIVLFAKLCPIFGGVQRSQRNFLLYSESNLYELKFHQFYYENKVIYEHLQSAMLVQRSKVQCFLYMSSFGSLELKKIIIVSSAADSIYYVK